jgi:dolichol-phosphate mannosyltransferase
VHATLVPQAVKRLVAEQNVNRIFSGIFYFKLRRMAESTQGESNLTSSPRGRVLVVLCTFNEIHTLPQVVQNLRIVAPECDVLIVDDNSPDGTGVWAQNESVSNSYCHLLARPSKLGLGSALRDAMQWCLERDYQFVVNLDADMSHDPREVPNLVVHCEQSGADVTIGSRYVAGGSTAGLSAFRTLISRTLNIYATSLLKLPVKDCSGSYRCYRVSALRKLKLAELACDGYGFLEEILAALHRQGAKLTEIPITYHVRKGGRSKLSLSDAVGALRVIHQLRA